MVRKLYALVALTAMALLMAPASASADENPYPAPSVNATEPVSTVVVGVTPAAQQAPIPNAPLASTGAGLDVGLWLGIGAAVLLVGLALTIAGSKILASRDARH